MEEKTHEQIALERIESVIRLRETELDLTEMNLEKLPTEIGHLTWLEKLDLESVGLKSLPKEIGLLGSLKELNLLDNKLQTLPREIGNLVSLEILNLDFNQIRDLPLEFANLKSLKQLDFDDNNSGYFPFAITKLTNLEGLYIMGNQIEYLPAEIGSLTQLEEFDINANLLTSLPTEFGNLANLKNLDISRNDFTEIPNELFNLNDLEELYAGENHITNISSDISKLKNLRQLNLGNGGAGLRYWAGETDYDNEISELPLELTHLRKLKILDLRGNPLSISPEILEKVNDPAAIFETYFRGGPPTPKRKLRVFLCHSSYDKPQIRKLYKRLIDDSIDVWLDEKNLLPGQDWEYEISKAVANSDAIIICLSNNSVSKEGFVQKEIRFALDKAEEKPEGTIFIIPSLLESCEVPQRLSKRHWVKLFEKNGYNLLLKALSVRATNLGLTK
ncbi:MAG: TIR domain-containing protein [Anaerolineales bacterium]|nr:TIR domain-containing protein [Anaerolineales bacterium]